MTRYKIQNAPTNHKTPIKPAINQRRKSQEGNKNGSAFAEGTEEMCRERKRGERGARRKQNSSPFLSPLLTFQSHTSLPPLQGCLLCCPLPPSPPPLSRDSNTFLCSWAKAHHEVRGLGTVHQRGTGSFNIQPLPLSHRHARPTAPGPTWRSLNGRGRGAARSTLGWGLEGEDAGSNTTATREERERGAENPKRQGKQGGRSPKIGGELIRSEEEE